MFPQGGKTYCVNTEVTAVVLYYLHEDWRSVIHEHVCAYEVNGVKGYGIFEFLYRSVIRNLIQRRAYMLTWNVLSPLPHSSPVTVELSINKTILNASAIKLFYFKKSTRFSSEAAADVAAADGAVGSRRCRQFCLNVCVYQQSVRRR